MDKTRFSIKNPRAEDARHDGAKHIGMARQVLAHYIPYERADSSRKAFRGGRTGRRLFQHNGSECRDPFGHHPHNADDGRHQRLVHIQITLILS